MIQLHLGDCLNVMGEIPDGSIDLICADLPYQATDCHWDKMIPIGPLWAHYQRLLKPLGSVVLTSVQPFTSMLVISNLDWFKYCLVWKKTRPGGHTSAKLKPLKNVEDICVFSSGTTANGSNRNMTYNPQGVTKPNGVWKRPAKYDGSEGVSYSRPSQLLERIPDGANYPRMIIEISNPNHAVVHPTQKPVALMEYLIKTYSNEGETVLDNTMGSGTTGIACINTNRNFTGIEKDETYFGVAKSRIDKHIKDQAFLLPLS